MFLSHQWGERRPQGWPIFCQDHSWPWVIIKILTIGPCISRMWLLLKPVSSRCYAIQIGSKTIFAFRNITPCSIPLSGPVDVVLWFPAPDCIATTLRCTLTHWGRVTYICVRELTNIGSDNGLSPGRRRAIIWINAGVLLIGPLGTNFNKIWVEIQTSSFIKMRLKVSSAKWRPFCLCLNVLSLHWYQR